MTIIEDGEVLTLDGEVMSKSLAAEGVKERVGCKGR